MDRGYTEHDVEWTRKWANDIQVLGYNEQAAMFSSLMVDLVSFDCTSSSMVVAYHGGEYHEQAIRHREN